jgi:hypothetical protein
MREKTLTIGGKVYRLTTVNARGFAELQERLLADVPCPVKSLVDTAKELPEDMRTDYINKHIDEATAEKKLQQKQKPSLDSPQFKAWLATLNGAIAAYGMLFRKHHPELTEEEVLDIVAEGMAEHGEDVLATLFSVELAAAAKSGRSRKAVPVK